MPEPSAPTLASVRQAAAVLGADVHRTPLLRSRTLDALTGAEVLLKAEHLQVTGSFKARGALTAVRSLPAGTGGVVAYSSGNHAQAVAWASRLAGLPAVIVMPHDAPASKRAATEGHGAEIVGYDRAGGDRANIARRLADERGWGLVPPYDSVDVMSGQGTVGLELAEDAGPLDLVLVCASGGGLSAGIATALAALSPATRVVAVEPTAGDDIARSLAAGHPVRVPQPVTIADGLATAVPGDLTFPVLARLLAGAVSVTDEEIVAAMRFLLERTKQVVEPSGAAALAALLSGRVGDVRGRRVAVTLSGGNVDAARLVALLG